MKAMCRALDAEYSRIHDIDKRLETKRRLSEAYSCLSMKKERVEELEGILSEEIRQLQDEREELVLKIMADIDLLAVPDHVDILQMRYVEGLAWSQISKKMGYTNRHAMRIRDDALEAIAKIKKLSP